MNRKGKVGFHMMKKSVRMPKHTVMSCVAAALLSASAAGVVLAEGEVLANFQNRIYINGGVGVTRIEPKSPSESLVVTDHSDTGAHIALGYDINRLLSVEGYFADLGAAHVSFLGSDAGSIDYQVFGLSALGYLYNTRSGLAFPDSDVDGLFRREGLSLYGRLGIGHMRNSSKGVEYFRDHPNHAVFGLGLEYGFTNGFAVRTELMAIDTDARYLNVGIVKRFGKSHVPAVLSVPAVMVPEPQPTARDLEVAEPLSPAPEAIATPEVYFAFDRTEIQSQFARDLDALAAVLIKNDVGIYIDGHTDWVGSEQYNMDLSERRASSVEMYLVDRGVNTQWLTTRGYGETRPVADNTTAQGRAANRRVEVILK